jgi:hypothetical protein
MYYSLLASPPLLFLTPLIFSLESGLREKYKKEQYWSSRNVNVNKSEAHTEAGSDGAHVVQVGNWLSSKNFP